MSKLFNLRTQVLCVLCCLARNLFIMSQSYRHFLFFKKKIYMYLTIFVSIRHEHDVNRAAIMVVFILPSNFTYKDVAAITSLFENASSVNTAENVPQR